MSAQKPKTLIKLSFLFAFAAAFTFLALRFPTGSTAASLDNFRPGNIISDYTMSNVDTMSVSDIQRFLSEKGNCNNTSIYQAAWYPSVSYHIENGHFVCLADERFGDGTRYGSDLAPGEGQTAAEIIYEVAHEYKINPQVLIVLLQKEQGLISDSWPNSLQYRSATGYGCPDTAACDSKYYGFKNQLKNAAALFRTVLDGGWTNYPLGENFIYYNPNRDCGGSVVNVENLATSALYRYTPYQPNAAALAAGYGTVSCGAYGNRNFYLYFVDYFNYDPDYEEDISKTAETSYEQPIANGVYQLISSASGLAMDVKGGVNEKMTQGELIGFGRKTGAANVQNQAFAITYNPQTGYYNIHNPTANLYLDIVDSSTNNNARVVLRTKNDNCSQDWLIQKTSDTKIIFISRCSSRVIDLTSSNDIIIFKNHGGENQQWELIPIDSSAGQKADIMEDVYYISPSSFQDKVIDIFGGVSKNSVSGKITPFAKKRATEASVDNQLFKIELDEATGYYKIINPLSGLALDVSGGSSANDTSVIVWPQNNQCNQRWDFRETAEGYMILSSCSNKKLSLNKDNRIIMREADDNYYQTWKIERYTDIFREGVAYQILDDNDMAIDVSGGLSDNMSFGKLITYARKTRDNENQKFSFIYDELSQTYYLTNQASRLYFDVEGASVKTGTKVILYNKNGGCNQKWIVHSEQEGKISLESKCSGKYLSISKENLNYNTSLVISDKDNSHTSQWRLMTAQ